MAVTINLDDFFASIKAQLENIKGTIEDAGFNGSVTSPGEDLGGDTGGETDAAIVFDPASALVNGTSGDDIALSGNQFFNLIDAGDGNDVLVGGKGFDILLGGLGVDTADYSYMNGEAGGDGTNGVFADLQAKFAVAGIQDVDILKSLENLIGSKHNDVLLGSEGGNVFLGNGGDDYIDGRGGIDVAQFHGQAEDYTVGVLTNDNTPTGTPIGYTFTRDLTGDVTKVVGIEYVQFQNPSSGGIDFFAISGPGGAGSVIAEDDDYVVSEDSDSGVTLEPLDNDAILGAVAQEMLGLVSPSDPGGPLVFTVEGDYGALTIDVLNDTVTYTTDDRADELQVGVDGTETFTYRVAGGDEATITITVTGTNDGPVLSGPQSSPAGIIEVADGGDNVGGFPRSEGSEALSTGGFFTVTDVDSNFGGTASAANALVTVSGPIATFTPTVGTEPLPAGLLTPFVLAVTIEPDGSGASATVHYSFQIQDSQIEFLGEGDVLSLLYTINVPDGDGLSVNKNVTITITGKNDGPTVASEIADHSTDEDALYSYDASANFDDIDIGDVLTYSATLENGDPLPAWLSIDPSTGILSGTPENGDVGPYSITVTVSDGLEDASSTFTLNVTNVNDAPVLGSIPDQTIDEEELVEATAGEVQALIDAAVSDPDAGDTAYVILTLTDSNGPFTYDSRDGDFSYTPPTDFAGDLTVTVTAYDAADAASNVQTFTLHVENVNDAPVLSVIPDQTIDEEETVSATAAEVQALIDAAVSDPDAGDTAYVILTLTDSNGPFTYDSRDGDFSYTPPTDFAGDLTVTVTAYDAADAASNVQTFTLHVENVNDAPVLSVIPDQTIDEEETVSATAAEVQALIDAAVSDPDAGDTAYVILTLTDSNGPFTYDSRDGDFSYTPPTDFAGDLTVTVTAYDAADAASNVQTFTLHVENVNDAPVLSVIPDQTIDEEETVSATAAEVQALIDAAVSDPDAGDTAYVILTLTDSNGPFTYDSRDGDFSYTPPTDFAGDLTVTVTAYDAADAASNVQTFTLHVENVNDAPVLSVIPDQTIDEEETVSATAAEVQALIDAAVSDPDAGDTAYVILTLTDSNGPFTYDSRDGDFSYTPPTDFAGDLTVTVTAYDAADAASNVQTFTLHVENVNDAPVLSVIPDQTIDEEELVEATAGEVQALIDAAVSDPDAGDTAYVILTLTDSNGPFTYDSRDGDFSYTPPTDFAGDLTVTVTAYDAADAASNVQTFTLHVENVNDAPVLSVIPDQTIDEEETVSATAAEVQALIDAAVSDPDAGDTAYVILTLTDSNGPFTYDSRDGDFSYTPPTDFAGDLTVTVTAYDAADAASNVQTFTLHVENVNDAPVLSVIPDQTIDEEETVSATAAEVQALIDAAVSDPDAGDTAYVILTLTDSNGPFTYDSRDGDFSYTPPTDFAGDLTVTVTAYDAADAASNVQTFTLHVENVNDAPVLSVIPDQTIDEEETVSATAAEVQALIDAAVSDPDAGDTAYVILTLTDSNGPFTYDSRDGDFSYTPPTDFAGDLTVTVTAYDAADAASNVQTFTLHVENVNDAPVLSVIPDQTIDEEETVSATAAEVQALIDAAVSDPDAGDTAYVILTLTDSNGPFTYDSRDGDFSYTPPTDFAGDLTVTVTAYDAADAASNVQTFTLHVENVNDAPVVTTAPDQNVGEVWEDGDLDNVTGATEAPDSKFEPNQNLDADVAALLDANPDDMAAVVAGVVSLLPPGGGAADAFAIIWDYVDDPYVDDWPNTYTSAELNEITARLGVEYAKYLLAGGKPLLDVYAKYTPDDGDGDTDPQRLQTLHDNLLGNLNGVGLADKLDTGSETYQEIIDLLDDEGLSHLLARPWYGGYQGETNNSLAWDQDHGLVPTAFGQLSSSDVDDGATAAWSGNATGTYGTFAITADGAWTYTLDNSLPKTQGLKEGETVTETFVATVSDGLGGTASQDVVITIHGSNDAPFVQGTSVLSGAVEEDGTQSVSGQIDATDVDDDAVLSYAVVDGQGDYGELAVDANGEWTYTLDNAAAQSLAEGETGPETFVVTVTDEHGATDSVTVTVDVTGANDAPTLGFHQGFETNDAGIVTSGGYGTVQVVENGDGGIFTADGGDFARLTETSYGPFTRFDGYRSEFVDGLTAEVQVYLDPNWTAGEGFDYSVATNGSDGNHQRDFIFHIAKDDNGELLVNASNNSSHTTSPDLPRQDLDTLPDSEEIGEAGWYTLQHVFNDVGGQLSVTMKLIDADGVVVFTKTLAAAADAIPAEVGGNRYGWFTLINVTGGLAVDSYKLGDLSGKVAEIFGATGDATLHVVEGEIPFLDVDLLDSHTPSVEADGVGYVGTLTAEIVNASTGDGEGVLKWTFTVADSAIDHLGAGQTAVQTYTVSIDDGDGGVASQTVTITITGTNDAASISGVTSGTVAEDSGLPASTVSGDLSHTDVDDNNADDVWQEVTTATASAEGYGTFTVTADGVWTYTLNDAHPAVDALEDGEPLLDSFTVYTEDGTAQVVTITITGTNDNPVIGTIGLTDLLEQTDTSDLTHNIVVNFTDAELLDTGHTATITGVSVLSGPIGPNTLDGLKALITSPVPAPASGGIGTATLTLVAASTVFDHLAAGEILELEYTVAIDDGDGGVGTQTFVVKITGTNDGPTINDLTGTFGEDDLDDLVAGINLLTLGGANDVDGDEVTIVADGGDLDTVLDGIDADLDVHFDSFFGDIDFSLPVEALIQTGLMSLDPDGTLTMHQSLADALQVLLDNGDTVNVEGTLTVTDVHGALAEADIDITLNGSNGVPDDLPIYGHGAEPDFLVPTFDHDGDPSNT